MPSCKPDPGGFRSNLGGTPSSMRCVSPSRFFKLMRMSAGSLGTNLALQILKVLSGWYKIGVCQNGF